MNRHAWYGLGDWLSDKIVASAAAGLMFIWESYIQKIITLL